MDSAVGNVLNDCQRTTAAHRRGVMQLHKLRASKGQQDAFLASFLQATNRVLKVYRREPAVERIASLLTDFVGSESSSQDTEDTPAGSASNLLNDFLRVRCSGTSNSRVWVQYTVNDQSLTRLAILKN